LTDHGRAEIERGLIGDIFDNDSADPERVALEARIDELEEQLDAYENKIDANKQLLHNLRSRVEKIGGVVEENRVRVNGMRWALEEKGIEVVEYVKRVKNRVS
jgi:chromosome segregation ATPase